MSISTWNGICDLQANFVLYRDAAKLLTWLLKDTQHHSVLEDKNPRSKKGAHEWQAERVTNTWN